MKFDIKNAIIPQPKFIKAKQGYTFFKNRIHVDIRVEMTPLVKSAEQLLNSFITPGHLTADFVITLSRADKNFSHKKLNSCKNKEQSYVIKPVLKNGFYAGLDILSYSDAGLYYACTTLCKCIHESSTDMVDIPYMNVADWPSIAYRGLFLGDYVSNLSDASLLKFNALDYVYDTKDISKELNTYEQCERYGINVFNAIFEWKDPVDVFEKLSKGKNNILFWANESWDEKTLYDETVSILQAYKDYLVKNPSCTAGVVTNYKGKNTFERIVELEVPDTFSLSYHDKQKTYTTQVKEIIPDTLKKYAHKKGPVGVYPLIAFDSNTFFLWSAPEFIQFRCAEFDRVNIQKVMGFIPFSTFLAEFNTTALAEWLWNAKGRNTVDFIKAYAYNKQLDFERFENMLYYLTFASWSLQRSNFVQCVCAEEIDFTNLEKVPRVKQIIRDGMKASKYAESLKDEKLLCEARSTTYALMAYKSVKALLKLTASRKPDQKKYIALREKLDECSKLVYTDLMQWAELSKDRIGAYDTIVFETAKSFLHLPEYFNIFPVESKTTDDKTKYFDTAPEHDIKAEVKTDKKSKVKKDIKVKQENKTEQVKDNDDND